MAKKKVVKSRKATKTRRSSSSTRSVSSNEIWGLDKDFILIVGGAFVIVVLGMWILY